MKRRDFLKSSTALLLLQGCLRPFSQIGSGNFKDHLIIFAPDNRLKLYNPNNDSVSDFNLPEKFVVHSIEVSPNNPNLVCVSEKWGVGLMTYDLREGRVVSSIKSKRGYQFLGHHLFSTDGNYIYATSAAGNSAGYQGYIVKYDAETLSELSRVPTQGVTPHQFKYINGNKEFIILNAGVSFKEDFVQQGSISIYDIQSERIIENIPTPDKVVVAHLEGDGNEFYCIGKQIYPDQNIKGIGYVFAYNKKDGIRPFPRNDQQSDIGESFLSCAYSSKHHVLGVTSYKEDMVYFYDTKNLQTINAFKLPIPMPIVTSNNGELFYVGSYGNGIHEIDVRTQKIIRKIKAIGDVPVGSHNQVL